MSLIPVFSPYVARYRFDQLDPTGEEIALGTQTQRAIAFSADGGTLFISDSSNMTIQRYLLSTPWDLSTAATTGPIILADPVGATSIGAMMHFSDDGFFGLVCIQEGGQDRLGMYQMSSAFGGPAALLSRVAGPSGSGIDGATFSKDGSRVFVVANSSFYSADASTPWDIRTLGAWSGVQLNLLSAHQNLRGFEFGEDDTQLILTEVVASGGLRRFHEYTLSTASDISTATLVQSYDHTGEVNSNLTDVVFGNDGRKFFAIGATDIVEYTAAS